MTGGSYDPQGGQNMLRCVPAMYMGISLIFD
jgi:hypothetical protein